MLTNSALPSACGTYALYLHLPRAEILRVGKFGTFRFSQGDYVYVGSAFGPGGLRARVARHMLANKHAHWHIDYLSAHSGLRGIAFTRSSRAMECEWSRALSACADARIPVAKFGATDCRQNCPAHLIAFPRGIALSELSELLREVETALVAAG